MSWWWRLGVLWKVQAYSYRQLRIKNVFFSSELPPPTIRFFQPTNESSSWVGVEMGRTVTTTWKMWNLKITQIKQENHKPLLLCPMSIFRGVPVGYMTFSSHCSLASLKLKSPELVHSKTPSWFKEFTKCTHNKELQQWYKFEKLKGAEKIGGLVRCFFFFQGGIISFRGCIPHRANGFHTSFLFFSGRISKWLAFVWPPRWWNQMHQIIGITQLVFKGWNKGNTWWSMKLNSIKPQIMELQDTSPP